MANTNPSDISYSLLVETTPGVTPATGTRYSYPSSVDQAPPKFEAAEIASNTKCPNRESNGPQQGAITGGVTLETRLQAGPVFDALLASALSGTWTAKTLKGGTTDSSLSLITVMKPNTEADPEGEPNGDYYFDAGGVVSGVSITATAKEGVMCSFDLMGMTRTKNAADSELPVTALPGTSYEFTYKDVRNVKIGGTTYDFTELKWESTTPREDQFALGHAQSVGVGTSGARETKLSLKMRRKQVADEMPTITGSPQTVSFEIGSPNNGYRITMPAANGKLPTEEVNGSSVMVNVDFTAGYHALSACGVLIEQL